MYRGNKFYRLTFDTTKNDPPAYLPIRNTYMQLPEHYLVVTLRIFSDGSTINKTNVPCLHSVASHPLSHLSTDFPDSQSSSIGVVPDSQHASVSDWSCWRWLHTYGTRSWHRLWRTRPGKDWSVEPSCCCSRWPQCRYSNRSCRRWCDRRRDQCRRKLCPQSPASSPGSLICPVASYKGLAQSYNSTMELQKVKEKNLTFSLFFYYQVFNFTCGKIHLLQSRLESIIPLPFYHFFCSWLFFSFQKDRLLHSW